MIIKALTDNVSLTDEYKSEHGLSLYIETASHRLLFDMGVSGVFIENAEKMGVDIKKVDTAVISHGHYDHGGGLEAFLQMNSDAKIYVQEKAFEKHYSIRRSGAAEYIGLNHKLKYNKRLIFTKHCFRIDDELLLLSDVNIREPLLSSNKSLLKDCGDKMDQDTFDHEQSLIISEKRKVVLIAGCAHRGIVNILEAATEATDRQMDFVIGGFHLHNYGTGKNADLQLIKQIGKRLVNTAGNYYTCHCTGLEPFTALKEVMKEKIQYLHAGSTIELI